MTSLPLSHSSFIILTQSDSHITALRLANLSECVGEDDHFTYDIDIISVK